MITNDIEKSWMAGFFEGEGSVGLRRQGRSRGMLVVELSQVDRQPLAWMQERWGGGIYAIKPKTSGGRPFFRWQMMAAKAVAFLKDIEPFVIRDQVQEKIALALSFQAQKTNLHENRTPKYRERQAAMIAQMTILNRRGIR